MVVMTSVVLMRQVTTFAPVFDSDAGISGKAFVSIGDTINATYSPAESGTTVFATRTGMLHGNMCSTCQTGI